MVLIEQVSDTIAQPIWDSIGPPPIRGARHVRDLVPAGLESHARILHGLYQRETPHGGGVWLEGTHPAPLLERPPAEADSTLRAFRGRRMSWRRLAEEHSAPYDAALTLAHFPQGLFWRPDLDGPHSGVLDIPSAEALAKLLGPHSLAVFSWEIPFQFPGYWLGPVSAAVQWSEQGFESPPNHWLALDQEWAVYTLQDGVSTLVSGPEDLVLKILEDERLDAFRIHHDAPVPHLVHDGW